MFCDLCRENDTVMREMSNFADTVPILHACRIPDIIHDRCSVLSGHDWSMITVCSMLTLLALAAFAFKREHSCRTYIQILSSHLTRFHFLNKKSSFPTMNLIALIYSLLSCSPAYAASMRNVDPPFKSRVPKITGSASLLSCKVCMDGFRVSRLRNEIVELDNGGRVSCQFLEQAMNNNASCLFYTKGTNTERIRSTCTCEAEAIVTSRFLESTDAETIQGEIIDTLTTLLVYIVFPGFVILMLILCRKRCLHPSAVHSQGHESDSDDARKQRECALEVMFPPSEGEKVGRKCVPCFLNRSSSEPCGSHLATMSNSRDVHQRR